jgi:hypothetical protein
VPDVTVQAVSFHSLLVHVRSPVTWAAWLAAAVYLQRGYVLLVAGVTGWTHRPVWYPYTTAGLCFCVAAAALAFCVVFSRTWWVGAARHPCCTG